jgi:hypothetical protein
LWADAAGGQTITRINTFAGAAAIQTAVLAMSNADFLQSWEGPLTVNGAPAPTAAQYLPVVPFALLYYLCADGTTAQLRIPSPQVGIFLADQATVDPANALIVALNTVVVGSMTNESGSLVTGYQAGRLESTPRR